MQSLSPLCQVEQRIIPGASDHNVFDDVRESDDLCKPHEQSRDDYKARLDHNSNIYMASHRLRYVTGITLLYACCT